MTIVLYKSLLITIKTIITNKDYLDIKDNRLKEIIGKNYLKEAIINGKTKLFKYTITNLAKLQPVIDFKVDELINNHGKLNEWIPFLSKEKITNLTFEFINGRQIDYFIMLIPFLNPSDLMKVSLKVIENDNYQTINLRVLIPFINKLFMTN